MGWVMAVVGLGQQGAVVLVRGLEGEATQSPATEAGQVEKQKHSCLRRDLVTGLCMEMRLDEGLLCDQDNARR